MQLITISEQWATVVEYAEVNRGGIGIITLNYGYKLAEEKFRELIVGLSTDDVTYQTYPTGDLMKKYAITAFIHSGLNMLPSSKIGKTIKMCNPDIKGSFTIVDCKTLKEAGKEGCRIVSIEGSPEFLSYLATTPKNHQFKVLYKKIYINGGKRLDSVTAHTGPLLPHAASAQLVKGINDVIMKSTQKRYENMRAFADLRHNLDTLLLNYLNTKLTSFPLYPLYTGPTMDQHTDKTEGTMQEETMPESRPLTRRDTDKPTRKTDIWTNRQRTMRDRQFSYAFVHVI